MVQLIPDAENELSKESAADCFQVRSLSEERLIKKIGTLNANTMDEIKQSLKKVFGM